MNTTGPVPETGDASALAYERCPLCQTTAAIRTHDAGSDWQCGRCGQRWTATRLASVTAYAAWLAERQVIPAPAANRP